MLAPPDVLVDTYTTLGVRKGWWKPLVWCPKLAARLGAQRRSEVDDVGLLVEEEGQRKGHRLNSFRRRRMMVRPAQARVIGPLAKSEDTGVANPSRRALAQSDYSAEMSRNSPPNLWK
jgi:hypothetical protein